MAFFRKKPVVIEAIQWLGSNFVEIDNFITVPHETFPSQGVIKIPTLEGVMEATEGDFIIKGVKGEFYPCKPDIFEATYDERADFVGYAVDSVDDGNYTVVVNSEIEIAPRNATPEETANSNRNDPLFGKAFAMASVCYEALEAYRWAQDATYERKKWHEQRDNGEALLQNMIDYISNNHFECELKDNEFLFFFEVADSLLNKF